MSRSWPVLVGCVTALVVFSFDNASAHGNHDHEHDHDDHGIKEQTTEIILVKVALLGACLGMALFFGGIPVFWKKIHSSELLLGVSNALSGGIFLAIALGHMLPEAAEGLGGFSEYPLAYMFTFGGYIMVLFVDKMTCDVHEFMHSHSDGQHGHFECHGHNHCVENEDVLCQIDTTCDTDLVENARNLSINNAPAPDHGHGHGHGNNRGHGHGHGHGHAHGNGNGPQKSPVQARAMPPTALKEASMENYVVLEDGNTDSSPLKQITVMQKVIPSHTSCILMIALGVHSTFEGLALGITNHQADIISLAVAILAHKWAEAFALGVSLARHKTSPRVSLFMVTAFAMSTPIGISIGMGIASINSPVVEATVMSVAAGSFLYIGATEVVAEEFNNKQYRWFKFIAFVGGAVAIFAVTILVGHEHEH